MRSFVFAKRNFKEIIRDSLSLIFCFAFPIVLFLMMKLIIGGVSGGDLTQTPQFKIDNLYPSICVFGFTFLTLFSSMLISKDRESSFQSRLLSSPLKPREFILGYAMPLVPIAFLQMLITTVVALIFGLKFNANILLGFVAFIPSMLLFVGFGILIGTIFSDKAAGGISSLIVNLAVLLGGMFFPLDIMTGFLPTLCNILPFAPALKLVKCALSGSCVGFWKAFLTVMIYLIVVFALAIWAFYKKMKTDKK